MPSEKQRDVLSVLVAVILGYIGYIHPSAVSALTLAAAVWAGMCTYLKE
ncbi:hypothetical protein OG345_41620 (plasmid) [Streptomyces sp. NBC_01220]|nr:hypothetical protein [Streptomyces sp. RTGN2]WSQ49486.1 hypothetical protein OG345_41620 [Streptomyces sp. NBC_01220]